MALPSALWHVRRWHGFVGATINVIFALVSIILLALLVTELQIKFGIDPADFIIDEPLPSHRCPITEVDTYVGGPGGWLYAQTNQKNYPVPHQTIGGHV